MGCKVADCLIHQPEPHGYTEGHARNNQPINIEPVDCLVGVAHHGRTRRTRALDTPNGRMAIHLVRTGQETGSLTRGSMEAPLRGLLGSLDGCDAVDDSCCDGCDPWEE